jgi:hypothetical protein
LAIYLSLEGDLYHPSFWRQYSAYDGGKTLALDRAMRGAMGR